MESNGSQINQESIPVSIPDGPSGSSNVVPKFKAPSAIPQDISLILEFVEPQQEAPLNLKPVVPRPQEDLDDGDSSDEEKNIVANALLKIEPT